LIAIQAEKDDILPNKDVYAHTSTGEGRWLNVTTFVYPVKDKAIGQVIVHLFRDATEEKDHQHFVSQVLAASEQLQKDDDLRVIPVAPSEDQPYGLTAREQQVLGLLAQGEGTDEIADTLVVSPATVRNHVQNLLNKLGVHSRLEAVAHAYQHGLIETHQS
jgi:DNA-binding NarL/FixJ family response regulator